MSRTAVVLVFVLLLVSSPAAAQDFGASPNSTETGDLGASNLTDTDGYNVRIGQNPYVEMSLNLSLLTNPLTTGSRFEVTVLGVADGRRIYEMEVSAVSEESEGLLPRLETSYGFDLRLPY